MKINLLRNIGWKLIGLILAFGLWFHLTTQNHFRQTITVNVEFANLNPNLRLVAENPPAVGLEIAANGKQLFQLIYLKPVRLVVDLGEYRTPGRYSIELVRHHLTIPEDMDEIRVGFIGVKSVEFVLDWKKPVNDSPRN